VYVEAVLDNWCCNFLDIIFDAVIITDYQQTGVLSRY
jgi:hypothetical protein